MNRAKIMELMVPEAGIKFINSLNFLPMPLAYLWLAYVAHINGTEFKILSLRTTDYDNTRRGLGTRLRIVVTTWVSYSSPSRTLRGKFEKIRVVRTTKLFLPSFHHFCFLNVT